MTAVRDVVVPVAVLCGAALAAWLGTRLWYWLTRLSIDIEAAEARYLAQGLRLAAVGQTPQVGPYVTAMLPTGPQDAAKLIVHVRVGAHNAGPIPRTVSRMVLNIGNHEGGAALEEDAVDDAGVRFKGSQVAAWDGYQSIDAFFVFGSNKYGLRGEWDYSDGATYVLTVTSSRKRRYRFALTASPPQQATRPAHIEWRRLRWPRNRVVLRDSRWPWADETANEEPTVDEEVPDRA